MAKSATKKNDKSEGGIKVISINKRARYNYEIGEKFEAGIVLTGAEIKSIRIAGINVNEAYVLIDSKGVFLLNAHIGHYSHDTAREYNPVRSRRLLLNQSEIDKLRGRVEKKGLTIVPLQVYLKNGYAKVEIAVGKGKAAPDKREDIKRRESDREIARAMKRG